MVLYPGDPKMQRAAGIEMVKDQAFMLPAIYNVRVGNGFGCILMGREELPNSYQVDEENLLGYINKSTPAMPRSAMLAENKLIQFIYSTLLCKQRSNV
jgi:hypothetical protein